MWQVKAWPENRWGTFYAGDSYIVLKAAKQKYAGQLAKS